MDAGEEEVTDDMRYIQASLARLEADVPATVPSVPVVLPRAVDRNAIDLEDDDESSLSSSSSAPSSPARGPRAIAETAEGDDEDDLQALVSRVHFTETLFGPVTANELGYNEGHLEPLPESLDESDWLTVVCVVSAVHPEANVCVAKALVPEHEKVRVLDMGSVIALASRNLIGRVDDVFGPVHEPFYVIRIMNPDTVAELHPGVLLCTVERFSSTVDPLSLNNKGTDASNMLDQERSDEDSDDEEDGDEADINDDVQKAGVDKVWGQKPRTTFAARGRGGARGGSRRHHRGKNRPFRAPASAPPPLLGGSIPPAPSLSYPPPPPST